MFFVKCNQVQLIWTKQTMLQKRLSVVGLCMEGKFNKKYND